MIEAAAGHCDVLCFQEGSDQQKTTQAFVAAHPDWLRFHDPTAGRDAVPILVKQSVAEAFGGAVVQYHLAVDRRWVGFVGAGRSEYAHKKFISHLILGGDLHILNTHMIPSAGRSLEYFKRLATSPLLGYKEWQARRQHIRDHVAAIVKYASSLPGTVQLNGDLNGQPSWGLFQPLHAAGFDGWTREATMRRKAIDHGLLLDRHGVAFEHLDTFVLGPDHGITSDHKLVGNLYRPKESAANLRLIDRRGAVG